MNIFDLDFQTKITLNGGSAIVQINGKNPKGEEVFAFVEMDKQKLETLKQDIEQKRQSDFANYGRIITSGKGTPSEFLTQQITYQFAGDEEEE